MKHITLAVCLTIMSSAWAHTEYDGNDGRPSPQELQMNRACFTELAQQGCGDPGENLQEFRICLHEAFPQLSSDCQKLMTKLYKKSS